MNKIGEIYLLKITLVIFENKYYNIVYMIKGKVSIRKCKAKRCGRDASKRPSIQR